ncbi:MAG: hypothetical protein ACRDZ0_07815 [Acidimicrobiales bacterium]
MAFVVLADGTEVELAIAKQSELHRLINGPYRARWTRTAPCRAWRVCPTR